MLRQKQEHIRAEQEKRDVEAMRARLVHKAKPMPSFLTEVKFLLLLLLVLTTDLNRVRCTGHPPSH